jgi:hypothetical protein
MLACHGKAHLLIVSDQTMYNYFEEMIFFCTDHVQLRFAINAAAASCLSMPRFSFSLL